MAKESETKKQSIEDLPGYEQKLHDVKMHEWFLMRVDAALRDAATLAQVPMDPHFRTQEQFVDMARMAYNDVLMTKCDYVQSEMNVWAREQLKKQQDEMAVATSDNKEETK